jgi:YD repeat-containing protein
MNEESWSGTMMNRYRITILALACLLLCTIKPSLASIYKYDNLHRVTRVVYNNGMQISYTYDEVGNRTQRVSALLADTSVDGTVNFYDFALLASRWLDETCISPDWCEGADIDRSRVVDFQDLAIVAQQWLEGATP